MNLKQLFLTILGLSLSVGQTAFASDWRPVDNAKFDASTITRISPSVICVWERTIFLKEDLDRLRMDKGRDYSDYSHTMNRKQIDCKERMIGGVISTDYNSHGGVIESFDERNVRYENIQMLPVVSGSHGEAFVQTVCDHVNKVTMEKASVKKVPKKKVYKKKR